MALRHGLKGIVIGRLNAPPSSETGSALQDSGIPCRQTCSVSVPSSSATISCGASRSSAGEIRTGAQCKFNAATCSLGRFRTHLNSDALGWVLP